MRSLRISASSARVFFDAFKLRSYNVKAPISCDFAASKGFAHDAIGG
jgi:hypothetical protein